MQLRQPQSSPPRRTFQPSRNTTSPATTDECGLGPNSNDDHPPSDVAAGQDLVLRVFHALRESPLWKTTLLLIVYDEHGGFYDHVQPPAAADDNADFRRLGVRVPAILASPLVAPKSCSSILLGEEFHFDHTSIIKTILTRFCNNDGKIPAVSTRVQAAKHLGYLLASQPPPAGPASHADVAQRMTELQQQWTDARFTDPVAAGGPPVRLTDFETGFYNAARLLRHAGLPAGRP